MGYVIIGNTIYFSKASIYTLLEYLSLSLGLEGLDGYPQASIILKGSKYLVYCSGDAELGFKLVEKYLMGIPYEMVKYSDKVFEGRELELELELVVNYLPIQDAYYEYHILERRGTP